MADPRELIWAAAFGTVVAWLACLVATSLGDHLPDAIDQGLLTLVTAMRCAP